VNNCLFFRREGKEINREVESLRKDEPHKFLIIEEEDDVSGFLGILLNRNKDGTLELKQEGLIQRVLDALGLDDVTGK